MQRGGKGVRVRWQQNPSWATAELGVVESGREIGAPTPGCVLRGAEQGAGLSGVPVLPGHRICELATATPAPLGDREDLRA